MRLPLTLTPRRSHSLTSALVVAHVGAGAALVLCAPPLFVVIGCAIVLACSLAHYLRRSGPIAAFTLRADGGLDALAADGRSIPLRVAADSVVFPWLVVLRLRGERPYTLVLPRDSLDGEAHRELRTWLRWKASAATAG